MKKTIYIAILFLTFGIVATSCKKEKSNPIEKGLFLNAIDTVTKFNVVAFGGGSYSYGMVFSVSKNGKVSELGCNMPTAGTYKLTLWDSSANRTILAQADVTVTAGGKNYTSISPKALTTGKIYLLTIQSSTNWYSATPKGGGNITYPIASGNINLLGYRWTGGTTSAFPTIVDLTYIAGFVDLAFQAD